MSKQNIKHNLLLTLCILLFQPTMCSGSSKNSWLSWGNAVIGGFAAATIVSTIVFFHAYNQLPKAKKVSAQAKDDQESVAASKQTLISSIEKQKKDAESDDKVTYIQNLQSSYMPKKKAQTESIAFASLYFTHYTSQSPHTFGLQFDELAIHPLIADKTKTYETQKKVRVGFGIGAGLSALGTAGAVAYKLGLFGKLTNKL